MTKSDGDEGATDATGDAGAPAKPSSKDGVVEGEHDVPATRPSRSLMEPPLRPSAMQLLADPEDFPDDGPFAAVLRRIDHYAGQVEQLALFGLLIVIVAIGVIQALATKLFDHSFLWSFGTVRAGTFAIAMTGAAFASHQARHLSMDLVSRKVGPRFRLGLRVGLGLFTIFATSLLLYSGIHLTSRLWGEEGVHTIPPHLIALMIPVGCILIMFHTTLHLLIDLDYLRRGKLPPEKAMTGH
ncbi:MAG: TRAP transporter small permease [Deltaproteobacteria bacterium]|nr:TRAP transporter small permease [Deltaproteobacteria bacterium]MDQ3299649.1 TRAP transporter small permease [Myxococcota bacterium]